MTAGQAVTFQAALAELMQLQYHHRMDKTAYVIVGELREWEGVEPWVVEALTDRKRAETRVAGLNASAGQLKQLLELVGFDWDPDIFESAYRADAADEKLHHDASYRLEFVPLDLTSSTATMA